VPSTPHETLNRAYEIAKSLNLRHVYIGNVLDDERQNTYCAACGELLVKRFGYPGEHVIDHLVDKNVCPRCGYKLKGIFE
jgi:pyruvate formate lyase activating enzyme